MDFISAAFSCLLPFPPSLPVSLSSLLSAAASPQALKESLTLHTHNHFRPGCLGRHLRWDVAATRCRPNQSAVQRKSKKKNLKTSTARVKQRGGRLVRERDRCGSIRLRASGSCSSSNWMIGGRPERTAAISRGSLSRNAPTSACEPWAGTCA